MKKAEPVVKIRATKYKKHYLISRSAKALAGRPEARRKIAAAILAYELTQENNG